MKNLKIILIALLGVAACLNVGAQDKALNQAVNSIEADYLAVKTALANNNGKEAEEKAKALLSDLNTPALKDIATEASTLIAKLQYDSRHISEVDRVAHQREHFASLSNNLCTLLKKLKASTTTIYREYCTMTKSYYLTDNEKAADPYMGMTTCSKTVEILKSAKQ